MPLLTHSDFVGPVAVASVDVDYVYEALQIFIDQREPEVMTDLFGVDGYKNLLIMNDAIMSSVHVTSSGVIGDGIFYVDSLLQWAKVKQHLYDIHIENLESPLIVKSAQITQNNPDLKTNLINAAFRGGSGIWLAYEVFDANGDLGFVYVNENKEIILTDPSSWMLTNNTIDDLIAESISRSAKIRSFGFYIEANAGDQRLQSIAIDGVLYSFADAQSTKLLLDDVKKIASHFVWYWYSRGKQSLTTVSGEMRQKSENAEPVGQADKQMSVWNDMSRMIRNMHHHKICKWNRKYAPINDLNF